MPCEFCPAVDVTPPLTSAAGLSRTTIKGPWGEPLLLEELLELSGVRLRRRKDRYLIGIRDGLGVARQVGVILLNGEICTREEPAFRKTDQRPRWRA